MSVSSVRETYCCETETETCGNRLRNRDTPPGPTTVNAVASASAVAASAAITWAVTWFVRPIPVRGSITCEYRTPADVDELG